MKIYFLNDTQFSTFQMYFSNIFYETRIPLHREWENTYFNGKIWEC